MKKSRFKILIIIFSVVLVGFLMFSISNTITLNVRIKKDIETLNSGSLDVPGSTYSSTYQLPEYVVEMMGKDSEAPEYGVLMSEVLSYVVVEKNNTSVFWNPKNVEYKIYAPDIESWLLNLDTTKEYTAQSLLDDMLEYIPTAPLREQVVVIEYTNVGLFKWQGDFMSLDFANAVSGGINTAYNKLYEQLAHDLEEAMK